MRNAYVYFSILLGLAIFLVVTFAVVFLKERFRNVWQRSDRKASQREDFYCVKSSLKQINDNFYVAQILFTNKKDCSLTTQGETRRRISED